MLYYEICFSIYTGSRNDAAIASKAGEVICFFVDEIQYMREDEMEALVNALHRVNQLRLPIIMFGAGLPKVLRILGEVKSYTERLFKFIPVAALSDEEAKEAIVQPAADLDVMYTEDAVERVIPTFLSNLDESFFKVRFERCTKKEHDFLFAMVKCGELPCTISNVAHFMKKGISSISPVRAQLINKGIIFSTGHGEIDFTVPLFDEYLKRVNPELIILKE